MKSYQNNAQYIVHRTSSLSMVLKGDASLETMPKYVSCPTPAGALSGKVGKRKVGGLSLASRTRTTTVTEENPVPVDVCTKITKQQPTMQWRRGKKR